MSVSESTIQIVAVIFAVRFIGGEAALEHASRRDDGAAVFRPVLGLRLGFGLGIPTFLYGASQLVNSREHGDLPYALLGLGMAIALFVLWPGTILVDKDGVRETRWFGLKRTHILWSDAAYAGGDIENSVTVRSKNDQTIQHTQYHVDRRGLPALKQQ